jgi:FkbM family methyltransferase
MRLRYLYRAFKARYRDQSEELDASLAVIRQGDTVVDAGANKGAYLYWLRRAVGASGSVFAFEPQPTLASYLQDVCRTMNWSNVQMKATALSDKVGTAKLFVPGEKDSPGASLESAAANNPGHAFDCPITTLDEQLANAERVSLLKVDVEGHELNLFRGAAQILKKHKPLIVFECEARHLTNHKPSDVFAYLQSLGYMGRFFSTTGLRPLAEFSLTIHQKSGGDRFWDAKDYCNNFCFSHPEARR